MSLNQMQVRTSSPGLTQQVKILSALVVLAHLSVTLVHGQAHRKLGVALVPWQQSFVFIVIMIAPLVALALLWTRFARLAVWILALSMGGALIFGAVHHYVLVSPDHVSHLPPGDAQGQFKATAALLLLTELFGMIVGLWGVRTLRSQN